MVTKEEIIAALETMCYTHIGKDIWYKPFGYMYFIFKIETLTWSSWFYPANENPDNSGSWACMNRRVFKTELTSIYQLLQYLQYEEHYAHKVGTPSVNWLTYPIAGVARAGS